MVTGVFGSLVEHCLNVMDLGRKLRGRHCDRLGRTRGVMMVVRGCVIVMMVMRRLRRGTLRQRISTIQWRCTRRGYTEWDFLVRLVVMVMMAKICGQQRLTWIDHESTY